MCQKMVIDPLRSLAINPVNLRILLQSTLSRFTSRLPIDLHYVFSWFPCARLSVDLFDLLSISSTSTLPGRSTSTSDFVSISSNLNLPSRSASTFDLLSIYLTSTLPGRSTSTFDLLSISSTFTTKNITT
jgi:hypothetical protein